MDSIEEAADALSRVPALDRNKIRARFEQRFSVERMTSEYLDIYRRLVHRRMDGAVVRALRKPAHLQLVRSQDQRIG